MNRKRGKKRERHINAPWSSLARASHSSPEHQLRERFAPTEVRDVKAIKAKALESISKELLRAAVMKGHTS